MCHNDHYTYSCGCVSKVFYQCDEKWDEESILRCDKLDVNIISVRNYCGKHLIEEGRAPHLNGTTKRTANDRFKIQG